MKTPLPERFAFTLVGWISHDFQPKSVITLAPIRVTLNVSITWPLRPIQYLRAKMLITRSHHSHLNCSKVAVLAINGLLARSNPECRHAL